ncbi:hypothetical protein WAK64_20630 [Bacillus spongiae]|uniref:Uncharacterized protein n=1 Tax=Bacillus spongiae TaxID=2683610 RepID=A0ABU8HJ63_9BACI
MNIKEAKQIIHAGLAWANWTDEQKEAMKVALQCMIRIEKLEKEVKGLEETRDHLNSAIKILK